jgi:periplasmic protein TonB
MFMKTNHAIKNRTMFRLLMILPVILIILVTFNSCSAGKKTAKTQKGEASLSQSDDKNSYRETDGEEPFVVVEEMPLFPGGSDSLLKFIAENTRYPEMAKKNNIQGKVIIRFCVTSKGGVAMISTLKSVNSELDAEAMRVVSILPKFIPGKQGGKAVPVWYMVPIQFALK